MESNNMQQQPETADQEIDLIELAQKLWQGRRMIVRWCIAGALAGLVIGFSIPKEYTVTVKLAPEIQGGKTSLGGLGSLASIAGINMGNMNSADAVSPDLYPDIVQSVPFMTELFGVEVADAKDRKTMPLYDYVYEELRGPWWGAVLAAPFKALGWFAGLFRAEEPEDEGPTDPFRLTKEENEVVRSLQERISTSVDKKTQVVSLSVTMQDPLIAATLTDTVMLNLQNHITQYRTDKARHDLEFTQRLFDEAQGKYYEAQQRYAQYVDQNQALSRRSFRTEEERLQNEMSLAYSLQPDGAAVAVGPGEGPGIDSGLRRGAARDGAFETFEAFEDDDSRGVRVSGRGRRRGVAAFRKGVRRGVRETGKNRRFDIVRR